MNVEIGTEAAQFLEKEYINGISFAVYIVFLSFTFNRRKKGTELHCKETIPKIRNKYSQKSKGIPTLIFLWATVFIYAQDQSAYSAAGK